MRKNELYSICWAVDYDIFVLKYYILNRLASNLLPKLKLKKKKNQLFNLPSFKGILLCIKNDIIPFLPKISTLVSFYLTSYLSELKYIL